MKKFFLFTLLLIAALAGSFYLFIWYAMGNKAFEITKFNANFFAQQVALYDHRIMFDFEEIRLSSQYGSPKVILKRPHLRFYADSGTYRLEAPSVALIGGFAQSHHYRVSLPEIFTLVKENNPVFRYEIVLKQVPEMELISRRLQEHPQSGPRAALFDHYKVKFPQPFSLMLKEDGQIVASQDYDLQPYGASQWRDIRYSIAPSVRQLVLHLQQLAANESGL